MSTTNTAELGALASRLVAIGAELRDMIGQLHLANIPGLIGAIVDLAGAEEGTADAAKALHDFVWNSTTHTTGKEAETYAKP